MCSLRSINRPSPAERFGRERYAQAGPPVGIIWVVAAVLALALPPSGYAQEDDRPQNYVEDVTNAGTSSAPFLEIGVGARAQAMGNAGAALPRDATSLYWNPAAAAGLTDMVNVTFDHTSWLANTTLDYVAAVFSFPGVGSLGFSVMSFDMVDEQPVRTILQPAGTGETYSASDLALAATYAARLTSRFSVGITGKYVQETLWHEKASNYAVDLGIVYETNLPGLSLAASLSNFGGDLQLNGRDLLRPIDDDPSNFSNDKLNARLATDEFSLPLQFRFGFGYQVASSMHRLTLAADLLHPSDNSEAVNLGAEYTFFDTISFRGGLVALFEADRTGGSTFGVGLQHRVLGQLGVAADYTYATWGILNNTHRVTVSISR